MNQAVSVEKNILAPIGAKEIPESHLRPLSKVDDANMKVLYEQAIENARTEGKKMGAKYVEQAVAEYLEKNKTLQMQLDDFQVKLDESNQHKAQLQDYQQQIIEAKVSEERARLLLENADAIGQAEHKVSELQNQLEQLKKQQAKVIKEGINQELSNRETEIRQLDYQVEVLQKQACELREACELLEAENGILKQHQDSIKAVRDAIQDIHAALFLAQESGNIPVELINQWQVLSDAIANLAGQFHTFCHRSVDSVVLDGKLIKSKPADEFGVENTFNTWGNA
jgi:chromosome segregation ATPase